MKLTGTRFGEIDVDARRVIAFRGGLIGFPHENKFVLLRPDTNKPVAWLQSLQTPALAFPVVESTQIAPRYPAEADKALAEQAGVADGSVAVFVVVSVRPRAPKVVANLLAPLVVDRASGNGAQIVLDAKRYSASTPLASMAAYVGSAEVDA
jgi:flagellar assembly factor FliW